MLNSAASSSAASPSPSSSVVSLKKYDVFLSFRGEDTRENFTSHLFNALIQNKVETYIDYRLEKGDEISHGLIKAIEGSLVSVVVFSENYASSKWCLDELSKILQCKRDHGQIVMPVFYKVDPSHVRKQTGSYHEAFAKHERDLKGQSDDDKLHKWRCALTEAANLSGWDSRTYRNESEFVKDIVKDILQKLNLRYPVELKGLVGTAGNFAQIESLLEIGSKDVRMIGIWGMGGIGKTTLAIALLLKWSSQFEAICFLSQVREQSEKYGIVALRKRLVSELLKEEEKLQVDLPQVKSHFVTTKLHRKKVFIVLDDVATLEQLEGLISDYDCFAPGSRVIITTRDKHIISHVDGIFEVRELNAHNSLQLFCVNAFKDKHPKEGFEELSENVIAYCKGNPLALKVLSSRLRSKSIEAWKSELRKLQKIQDVNIHNVMKLSFNDLDPTEQGIFLDIACFFKGESRDHVTSLMDAFGFFATAGIENLIDKSLLTISDDDRVQMHDLIQEMGQNVVRQESDKDPGRRSRLWDPDEVYDVLKNNKGTEAIECIVLDVSKIKDLHLSFNSFTKMTNIRFLKFYSSKLTEGCKIYLPNGLESLSNKLRHLEWPGYCLETLPSTFCAEMLVNLAMPRSRLQKLWDGVQNLVSLKKIDLGFSKLLVELPDLSMATNLEALYLDDCKSLCQVHPSILSLQKLLYLDLQGCTKIDSLETNVHLKSLRRLNLTFCSSLKKFSVFSEKLETLWLHGTIIHELPSSIWRCEKLVNMSLSGCYNLQDFGSKLYLDSGMRFLRDLNLSGCKLLNESSLSFILDGMRSLIRLHLQNCCNLQALPDSIVSASSLEYLYLSQSNVEILSPNIKNLLKLKELWLDDCRKLVSLPELPPSLQLLSAINCKSLQTDITQLVEQKISSRHERNCGYVLLPGVQVPNLFSFRAEGDSIMFPRFPLSGICGFICCLILPHLPLDNHHHGRVICYINKQYSKQIFVTKMWFALGRISTSDHVLLGYMDIKDWEIQKSWGCELNSMSFELWLNDNNGLQFIKQKIKRCGVCPVSTSQERTIIEVQPTSPVFGNRGSTHNNEDDPQTITTVSKEHGCKRKAPSFKKEESSRPEKHIIPFDSSRASNVDLNLTIEVLEGKDFFDSQVGKCPKLVMFEKSHTRMEIDNPRLKPDWDPIGEIESILSDGYKVSPLSGHSTCISQSPNVKAILEKLETILDTSLEIISSDYEVKQQFHHVLEQLGRFEGEIPVRLHLVIYKLKTFIEGFDFRFATAQKTIQDYHQLLQSKSLLAKQLEIAKAQQDQIKSIVAELKIQIDKVNSEIGEKEKELSVLVEARDRLKRDLDYYDAENSRLKTHVAQWMPECKTIITALKNSETSYIVSVNNKKIYEDEWADLKKSFVANKI